MYKDNLSLIEGLSHGEESAYAHLLKLYHKRLFAYVLTLTHNHAAAEDIIQNVFLKLWEYRDKLDPDYSLKNFLYRSCYNEFVNHYKKKKGIIGGAWNPFRKRLGLGKHVDFKELIEECGLELISEERVNRIDTNSRMLVCQVP